MMGGNQTAQEVDTNLVDTTQQEVQQDQPFLTVKYNKDEVSLDRDRAIEYAQKGMNYDHVYEELNQLRNNPGMSYLDKQAQQYGMTVEQLVQAYQQQEQQEELNNLIQNNIPPHFAQEMLENRKFREQYQTERETNQQKTQQEQMYNEFLQTYPEFNDPQKANEISVDVWARVQQGKNLTDAYNEHKVKEYQKQFEALQTKEQAAAANQANALSSTGSVKSEGVPSTGYISKDVFEANKGNQKWMYEHFDEIKKSMGKWR